MGSSLSSISHGKPVALYHEKLYIFIEVMLYVLLMVGSSLPWWYLVYVCVCFQFHGKCQINLHEMYVFLWRRGYIFGCAFFEFSPMEDVWIPHGELRVQGLSFWWHEIWWKKKNDVWIWIEQVSPCFSCVSVISVTTVDSGSKALEFLGIEGDGGSMQIHVKVLQLSLSLSLTHTHTHTHTYLWFHWYGDPDSLNLSIDVWGYFSWKSFIVVGNFWRRLIWYCLYVILCFVCQNPVRQIILMFSGRVWRVIDGNVILFFCFYRLASLSQIIACQEWLDMIFWRE